MKRSILKVIGTGLLIMLTAAPAAKAASRNARLFLSGVAFYGDYRVAIIEVRTGNHTERVQVREGEKIGGYTLDKVEKDRIILNRGGKEKTLFLQRGTIDAEARKKKPGLSKVKRSAKREEGDMKRGNSSGIKRYKPGEINLSEHKEEAKRGILEIIKHFPNPAALPGENQ